VCSEKLNERPLALIAINNAWNSSEVAVGKSLKLCPTMYVVAPSGSVNRLEIPRGFVPAYCPRCPRSR
jgi:hypothetical protein